MLEIGMKVCWIGEGSLSASFLSFLISVADTFPLFSSLFVALSTPLTNRVSLTLILLALDISLMSTLEQAETPSSPTDVGPASETQAFTWKSLSLYDSELSSKTICWNLDPDFTDVRTWEPYLFRKVRYSFQELWNQGVSTINGKFSK